MKPWIYLTAILIIGAAVIISGCTSNVQSDEKDKPLYTITEKPCGEFIAVDVINVELDNRAALTAGLTEVGGKHKVKFWTTKQSVTSGGYSVSSGYDIQVEINESCRQ